MPSRQPMGPPTAGTAALWYTRLMASGASPPPPAVSRPRAVFTAAVSEVIGCSTLYTGVSNWSRNCTIATWASGMTALRSVISAVASALAWAMPGPIEPVVSMAISTSTEVGGVVVSPGGTPMVKLVDAEPPAATVTAAAPGSTEASAAGAVNPTRVVRAAAHSHRVRLSLRTIPFSVQRVARAPSWHRVDRPRRVLAAGDPMVRPANGPDNQTLVLALRDNVLPGERG